MRSVVFAILMSMLFAPVPQTLPSSGPPYDTTKWTLVKRAEANLGMAGPMQVLLLKSSAPTDEGGAGQPLSDIQFLIVRNGQVRYDYIKDGRKTTTPDQDATKFYVGDDLRDLYGLGNGNLNIRDVTSDGIPEIIFHSGHEAASDFVTLEHILKYNGATNSFTDIADSQFFQTGTHEFRWLTLGKREIAVISRRGKWSSSKMIEDHCHYCDSQFIYDAYEWNQPKESFKKVQTIASKQAHSDGSEALDEEWPYIASVLQRVHP